MNNDKFNLLRATLDRMLDVSRVGIEEGKKHLERNPDNDFFKKLTAKYEGREAALVDVIQMLEDEDFFFQMVGNYKVID